MIPFTADEFFAVFEAYNRAAWPAQIVLVLTALAVVLLAAGSWSRRDTVIAGLLGLLWIWMGAIYHLAFFTAINPAAYLFGALFVLQGLLFFVEARRGRIAFHATRDAYGWTGAAIAGYALVLYPALGMLAGHGYPAMPTFGAPCPTTIFTFAVLLWADRNVPARLLVIPVLWSLIGVAAALSLGVPEDLGLIVAAVAATTPILVRKRRARPAPAQTPQVTLVR